MPRRPRVFVEGGIYHVYNRFARGADLKGSWYGGIDLTKVQHKVEEKRGGAETENIARQRR